MSGDLPSLSGQVVYLVRHCQSSGQAPEAPLTELGHQQALRLADQLADLGIRRIVTSPYTRARQSVEPLAQRLGLAVETDERLVERMLAADSLPDWQDRIRASFDDLRVALPGGESTATATERGMQALANVLSNDLLPTVVASHGNLLAALLHHLDGRPGYETWLGLTNPDVFEVVAHEDGGDGARRWSIERRWSD